MSFSVLLNYSDPLWKNDRSGYIDSVSHSMESYSDTTSAIGGYDNASFSINDSPNNIEDWIESGIGRHVESFNESAEKRWEGFVNQIQVSLGPLSFTRGPLLDVGNEIKLRYVDFTGGTQDVTSTATDTDSQDEFGIKEKTLSTGRISSTNANSIRDNYLEEGKYPESSQSLGDASGPALTVNCLGYYHMLNYIYNNSGTSTYTLREKLIDVLSAEPNGIFSSDTSNLTTNTLSVFEKEDEDKVAWDVIKSLVALGPDSGNARMLYGIYDDLTPEYRQVPSDILYTQRLDDVGVNLQSSGGGFVDPWDIQVGQWIQFTDFLIGRNIPQSTFREDPRIMFIESVTYTAPYGVSLTGGKTQTLTQQLAKLGLGGI